MADPKRSPVAVKIYNESYEGLPEESAVHKTAAQPRLHSVHYNIYTEHACE